MSGCSDSMSCPICGTNMDVYTDWKPIDTVSGQCLTCGFTYYTKMERMKFNQVKELRKDYELTPITKLDYNVWADKVQKFLKSCGW